MHQIATHDIERHLRSGVTDVAIVVDRIAAQIHPDFTGLDRAQRLFLTREGIMDPNHVAELQRASRARIRSGVNNASSGASSGPCPCPVRA